MCAGSSLHQCRLVIMVVPESVNLFTIMSSFKDSPIYVKKEITYLHFLQFQQ